MKILVNNIGENKFIVKYKENSYVLNETNPSIEVQMIEDRAKIIITKNFNLESRKVITIGNIIITLFITLFLYLIDFIGFDLESFNSLLGLPVSEEYIFIADKEKSYVLTYHSGEFESSAGKYSFPYFSNEQNSKLEVRYSYDSRNIKAEYIYALIYHTYSAILISFVIGLAMASIIGKSFLSFLICWGISFIGAMVIIFMLLNRSKKRLVEQLDTRCLDKL